MPKPTSTRTGSARDSADQAERKAMGMMGTAQIRAAEAACCGVPGRARRFAHRR